MCCLGHKGGTGSSSRVIDGFWAKESEGTLEKHQFTIGALTQCNFGGKRWLTIGGAPIGRLLVEEEERRESEKANAKVEPIGGKQKDGSIIVVLATDAPLSPIQLQRIAKRAASGMAKVGGWASHQSGDIFLAFSTAHDVPRDEGRSWTPTVRRSLPVLDDMTIDAMFEATVSFKISDTKH